MPCTTILVGKKASYDGSTKSQEMMILVPDITHPKNLQSFIQKTSRENTDRFCLT